MKGSKLFYTIFAAVFLVTIAWTTLPAFAVVTNYRSIGTNRDVLYSYGSASIAAGSMVVDFSDGVSLPANIGAGDRLTIADEAFFILSRESETRVQVQSTALQEHQDAEFTISRANHRIQGWGSARGGNLVEENRREIGVCSNDGVFRSTNRFAVATIKGSQTDAVHYMELTVAENQRHNGLAGSGVILDGANRTKYEIRVMDDYTRVEWLEMRRFRRYNGSAAIQVKRARRVLLGQLMIHNFNARRYRAVGIKGSRGSGFTARNCIIYDGGKAAIRTVAQDGRALIANCTIYGMAGRGVFEDYGRYTVLNTISMGNRKEDFSIIRGIQGFNISSDDTAAGITSQNYLDAADQFVSVVPGEEDFHLQNGADAIDIAANLAVLFTIDCDGPQRPSGAGWDIGADEYKIFSSGIWYVDSEKYGNGTSWEEAFETVQQAVEAARPGEEIWVKTGIYPLLSEIIIDKSVEIYGCFNGTETRREERDCRLYDSTLDGGDIVRCLSISSEGVIIDGLIISHGYDDMGGGIYASAASDFKISNCTIKNNNSNIGGGFYSEAPDGEIFNCIFSENSAAEYGGGIYLLNSALNITNCIFTQNQAGDTGGPGGGAIFNAYSYPTITNSTFSGNTARAGSEGGAIFNKFSDPEITNCILWGNVAGYGPEIVDDEMSWSTVLFSNIDWDGFAGKDGNIRMMPCWVNPAENDFHLKSDSPCINTGTNEAPNLQETDFEGDPRIVGENVDMGADEFKPE
jgi:hypothetical protein